MIERVKEMKNEIQLTSEVGTMLKVIDGERTHRLKVLHETPTVDTESLRRLWESL